MASAAHREEPYSIELLDEDPSSKRIFQQIGLYAFFSKFRGHNEDVTKEFALNFDGACSNIQGFLLPVSETSIALAAGLPQTGERWFKVGRLKNPDSWKQFVKVANSSIHWKKGAERNCFTAEWGNVIFFLQKYLTCEGRYSLVFLYHIRLLLHIKGEELMNIPYFLWKSLSKMASAAQKRPDQRLGNSLYHHGLIKLLIVEELQKSNLTWEQFLVEKGFQEQVNDDPQDSVSPPPTVQTEFDPAPTFSEPIQSQPSPKRHRDDEEVNKISVTVRRRSARLEGISEEVIEKVRTSEDMFSTIPKRTRTRYTQSQNLESTPLPELEATQFQDQAQREEDESNQVVRPDSPGLISSKLQKRIKKLQKQVREFQVLDRYVKNENEKLKQRSRQLQRKNGVLKKRLKILRNKAHRWSLQNKRLRKQNKFLRDKSVLKESVPLAEDNTSLELLATAAAENILPSTSKSSEDKEKVTDVLYEFFNQILDDVWTNTLALASAEVNTVKWIGRNDELYDLGLIYQQRYKFEVQRMQETWFSAYLVQEQKWKSKIQSLQQQLMIKEEEKRQMFQFAEQAISCRSPARVYSMYLHEQWVGLQMIRLNNNKKFMIGNVDDFVDIYNDSSTREKDLLCELYQFKFFLEHELEWNPNPVVGDIQLRAFSSFIQNQIKWEIGMKFFYKLEFQSELHVRGEHPDAEVAFSSHSQFLRDPMRVKQFRMNQRSALQSFEELISCGTLASLQASETRWNLLPPVLQQRDPMGYPFFQVAFSRTSLYVNSLRRNGTQWLGLRFHFLLLWCSKTEYSVVGQWYDFAENSSWMEVDHHLGFRERNGVSHPSYSWTELHQNLLRGE